MKLKFGAQFQTKSYFSEFNFTETDLFYAYLISDDLR